MWTAHTRVESREGAQDNVSVVGMGEGVNLSGIFEMLGREGVGEDE